MTDRIDPKAIADELRVRGRASYTERAAVSAIVLTAMGDAWSDSEEYSALPGVTADLLLTSDWLAERDRQVAERAWEEGHMVHGADGWPREDGYCRISGGCIADNPYRKEQENNNA